MRGGFMKTQMFEVDNMHCAACEANVTKILSNIPGVTLATVNLLMHTAVVEYDEVICNEGIIMETVESAGYGMKLLHEKKDVEENKQRKKNNKGENKGNWGLFRILSIGVLGTLLMYIAMHHMFLEYLKIPVPKIIVEFIHGPENAINNALTQFLLVLAIVFLSLEIFANGFKALFRRKANMDSLIAVGAFSAILYGIYTMFLIGYQMGHGMGHEPNLAHDELYFESAGIILAIVQLGRYFEERSKEKTLNALRKLVDKTPKMATLLRNGQEIKVPIEEIMVGEQFVVYPGETIPADGEVIRGESYVNEAILTGESEWIEKSPGTSVIMASMNQSGTLVCLAKQVGENTKYSNVLKLVEKASSSKVPIAKLADQIASVFVPMIIGLAMIIFLIWWFVSKDLSMAFSFALAVLVISCPCALGLATPVTLMVGTGLFAKHGILFKSGEVIQRLIQVDTIVLDKTGTLTKGEPRVMDLVVDTSLDTENELLKIAVTLERSSEHSLAKAVLKYCEERGIEPNEQDQFLAIFGKGVQGKPVFRNEIWYLGNERFMDEKNLELPSHFEEFINHNQNSGNTLLFLGSGKRVYAILALADEIREESERAVQEFLKMGYTVIMATGDHYKAAKGVGNRLGIKSVMADLLPEDKLALVERLKQEQKKVLMVGDGVNDAPSLASAYVGVTMGSGIDIAIESGDFVITRNDPSKVISAIKLSKLIMRTMKQNLFWAFLYNCISIPVAAGAFYVAFGWKLNPMIAALCMSLSSLFVVGNALRIRNAKR